MSGHENVQWIIVWMIQQQVNVCFGLNAMNLQNRLMPENVNVSKQIQGALSQISGNDITPKVYIKFLMKIKEANMKLPWQ